jgi:coproporphyrinogen III oxidase
MIAKDEIANWLMTLQESICQALEQADGGATFQEDKWEREGGGGGRTRVIANGNVIEKGGVNFSAVFGETPEKILKKLGFEKQDFFATGVSIVLHPKSPMVPIIHMNVRYFEMTGGTWWFGGGIDLTPHYVVDADARFFHQQLQKVCDKHNQSFYLKFKTWADDYFYIKHRKETRGIGGIFFDHLNESSTGLSKKALWAFVQEVGQTFAPTYVALMNKTRNLPYSEREANWQEVRRGRYTEFNLVYDAGTKFGLDTDGRTESILMSLPPRAQWHYMHTPEPGSAEAETLSKLIKGINWVEANAIA